MLLQLRHNTGYMDGFWAAGAAGHIEFGETVYQAAAREVQEELGLRVDHDELAPLCTMHRSQPPRGGREERVDFFFDCHQWSGEPRIQEPHKAEDLRWFPLDGLPDKVVAHERRVLEAASAGSLSPIESFGFDDG